MKYWSIGNENGYPNHAGPPTAELFARKVLECAKAMKEADPSISLAVSGSITRWRPDWDAHVIAVMRDLLDHYSFHYYIPGIDDYTPEHVKESVATILRDGSDSLAYLPNYRQILDSHTRA